MSDKKDKRSRRDFMKLGATAGMTAVVGGSLFTNFKTLKQEKIIPPLTPFKVDPIKTVKVGFVGTGLQGSGHVRNFMKLEGVEIRAICDIAEEKVKRHQDYT